jgi:DNA polymerase I
MSCELEHALLRGRYMKAAAQIELNGIPLDVPALNALKQNWSEIQDELIRRIDLDYGVYDGRTFKVERFAKYLQDHDIEWPYLPSGALDLKEETFRQMSKMYPDILPLHELRYALSQLRLSDLAVGSDGRNRTMLSAFRARTGRNQPSNSKFIFGPAVWLRGLIRPHEGRALAYIDWSQQEFGIAAALSNDEKMMEAYTSGDPYLAFAKQARAVPADATKKSHSSIREQFKACVLAVQYGMGEQSLATRIGQPVCQARELLRMHHETYATFWRWSDSALDFAMLNGWIHTVFGWRVHIGTQPNARSVRNFPMQANGAEMLRLACCFCTETGINVCAPVHDAILIEASLSVIDAAVRDTQRLMEQASAQVLGGFRLRSDAKIIRHPDRYQDERGIKMWSTVWEIIEKLECGRSVAA